MTTEVEGDTQVERVLSVEAMASHLENACMRLQKVVSEVGKSL